MHKHIPWRTVYTIIVLNVLLIIGYILLNNTPLKKYDEILLKDPYIEFLLKPVHSESTAIVTDAPTVYTQTSPSSSKYYLTYLKDALFERTGDSDQLFLASKRISELITWTRDLDVVGNYQNPSQLRKWWLENKPSLRNPLFIGINSWEAGLARYQQNILHELESIPPHSAREVERLNFLRNYVIAHEDKLDEALYDLPDKDRVKYLQTTVDNFFGYYVNLINSRMPEQAPNKIAYSLEELQTQKETGIFNARIDSLSLSTFSDRTFSLHDGTHDYKAVELIPDATSTIQQLFIFDKVAIDDSKKHLFLNTYPINYLENLAWQKKENDSHYMYVIELSLPPTPTRYYISLNYQVPTKATLQYEINNIEAEKNTRTNKIEYVSKPTVLFKKALIPKSHSTLFERHIVLSSKKAEPIRTNFTIISSTPLSDEVLKSLKLNYIPLIEPEIRVERQAFLSNSTPNILYQKKSSGVYTITFQYVGDARKQAVLHSYSTRWAIIEKDRDNYELQYLPSYFLKWLIFMLDGLFLMYSIHWARKKKITIRTQRFQTVQEAWSRFWSFDVKLSKLALTRSLIFIETYKFQLVLAGIVSLLIHIFFLGRESSQFIPIIVILLFVTGIGYRVDSQIHFFMTMVFTAFTVMLYVLNAGDIAEKTAIWIYFFLLLGIFQLVWTARKTVSFRNLWQFFDILKKDAVIFFRHIPAPVRFVMDFFWGNLRKGIIRIYGPRPSTPLDYVILTLKLIITTIILICLGFLMYKISNIRLKESLKPYSETIQPRLVYPATKVVIRGSNFGWKQSEDVKLMKGNEEVSTDLWTSTEIIFTVPLHWKEGNITLRITKPVLWKGRKEVVDSKIFTLQLIPRHTGWWPIDDLFFAQLETLDPQVLKLNGYQ